MANCFFLSNTLASSNICVKKRQFAIFGSSIFATWLSNYLKKINCFVDEDKNRIGKIHQGKPICALSQLPLDMPIYVALPLQMAQAIVSRYANEKRNFILPPNLQTGVTP